MAEMKKFEDALGELEGIVRKLEGDMPLDEAVKAFERG
ncbi:MAG: exodeoxyribonuclease VII small subunit, partial [Clostridia bacterium]|nr:exodeoxyribonuclease VII small subunit [Clostridia bacterium]